MGKIKVFLSDWQVLFREGIHFTLSGEEDFEVIGEATANDDALAFIEGNVPQVAVLNINGGKLNGIETTRRIKQNLPSVSVILVMDSDDEEKRFLALKSAASACTTKDIDPDDLIDLIRLVAEGSYPISQSLLKPGVASRTVAEFEAVLAMGEPLSNLMAYLTPIENDILGKANEVNSKEEIIQVLGINDWAVEQNLELIRTKLVANEHSRRLVEAAQSILPVMPQARFAGRPVVDYVTRDEFFAFKESLKEHFKSFTGELV